MKHEDIQLASTVTKLGPECADKAVVGGSHGPDGTPRVRT